MSTVTTQPATAAAGGLLPRERLEEMAALLAAVRDALSAESVTAMTRLAVQLGEAADELTRPEMASLLSEMAGSAPALREALRLLRELEAGGTLRRLEALLALVQAVTDALTSESLAGLLGRLLPWLELLDRLGDSRLVAKLPALVQAVDETLAEPPSPRERGGMLRLVRAVREPEIQDALTAGLGLMRRVAPVLRAG
ncbi:MAG: hypothetical protein IRZ26_05735 [Clostridia bacterium]|nr:hypothetical protein [Clostridia bacterium]